MLLDNKNFQNLQNFCAAPAPLLWKSLFLIVPLLILILIFLAVSIVWTMIGNKKSRKKIMDKKIKIKLIHFLVVFFSLIAYGIIGLDYSVYPLVFFIIAMLIIGSYYLVEYFKLMKIKREAWIWTTMAGLIFAVLFIVCYSSPIHHNFTAGEDFQGECPSRIFF